MSSITRGIKEYKVRVLLIGRGLAPYIHQACKPDGEIVYGFYFGDIPVEISQKLFDSFEPQVIADYLEIERNRLAEVMGGQLQVN